MGDPPPPAEAHGDSLSCWMPSLVGPCDGPKNEMPQEDHVDASGLEKITQDGNSSLLAFGHVM